MRKFYKYSSVPRTSLAYTEQSVLDTLILSYAIEFPGGANVLDTKAAIDKDSNE